MRVAHFEGRRASAEEAGRGAIGRCPWTNAEVKAHVGAERQYWAYTGGAPRLTDGYESDTDFHEWWKAHAHLSELEVILQRGDTRHIADVFKADERVIELQARPMGKAAFESRMKLYSDILDVMQVTFILDVREMWQKSLKLVENAPEAGYANRYIVQQKPRRAWLWEIVKHADTTVFADYRLDSDKVLKLWVYKGEMFGAFYKKEAVLSEHFGSDRVLAA